MEHLTVTYSVQDVLLIIGAITTMVCSIIAALKTTTTGRKLDDTRNYLDKQEERLDGHRERLNGHLRKQDETLNAIETQTNGNLADVQAQVTVLRQENVALKASLADKTKSNK